MQSLRRLLLQVPPPVLFPKRSFLVLGLESSADDTCASVVSSTREILSNVVLKQNHLHEKYGGINPYVALHQHQQNMPLAIRRAVEESGIAGVENELDGVAFTRGPGMGGGLSVCVNAGKGIASVLGKPIVGVHHMQAHALTPLLTSEVPPTFPFFALLVSGGHTLLLLCVSHRKFEIVANTVDSPIGWAIDQVAKLLKLEWTRGGSKGGPGAALEKYAAECTTDVKAMVDELMIPMPGQLKFAFACIDQQVKAVLEKLGVADFSRKDVDAPLGDLKLNDEQKRVTSKVIQTLVMKQLEEKLKLAFHTCGSYGGNVVKELVVSGGVASNEYLRSRLQSAFPDTRLIFPPAHLCTDNAAMIAWCSMHRFLEGDVDGYEVDLRSRWSIEDLNISEETDGNRFQRNTLSSKKNRYWTGWREWTASRGS